MISIAQEAIVLDPNPAFSPQTYLNII